MTAPSAFTLLRNATTGYQTLFILSFSYLLFFQCPISFAAASDAPTCSAGADLNDSDPDLRSMIFDVGYGPERFDFYVEPEVSMFYGDDAGSRTVATPVFNGFAGKFVNMSPQSLQLFW